MTRHFLAQSIQTRFTHVFCRALMVLLAAFYVTTTVHAQPAPKAQATTASPPAQARTNAAVTNDPAANMTLAEGYVLGPGDVLEIAVLGRDEFRPRVQVQVDGTIQLPYLHSVNAANLTVLQLRDKVAQLLREGGYYVDPVVSVTVASYASRYVTVLGEFGTPGLLPVDRAYRVSEILARAGGVRATGGDDIMVSRVNGEQMVLPISTIARGGPAEDPFVQPGDKLYIAMAPNFYIYGQVNAPGAYRAERGMTVRMALARGGGLTDRGSSKRISVFRNGKKAKVNLDEVITGGDTLVIGERFF